MFDTSDAVILNVQYNCTIDNILETIDNWCTASVNAQLLINEVLMEIFSIGKSGHIIKFYLQNFGQIIINTTMLSNKCLISIYRLSLIEPESFYIYLDNIERLIIDIFVFERTRNLLNSTVIMYLLYLLMRRFNVLNFIYVSRINIILSSKILNDLKQLTMIKSF